jgi:SAM-dependent methyltransferase
MTGISYTGRDNLEAMQEAHRYNECLLNLVRHAARRGDVLVDFGAGIGTFARALAKEGLSIHCVEPDVHQASVIQQAGLPVASSLRGLPVAGVDLIYTFNVLEHIKHDDAVLGEFCSALRPGGLLLVYVPAFPILFSSMDRKVGHFRRYRRKDLGSKLSAAGFEIVSMRYADSLGFLASLAYRFLGRASGDIDPKAVAFYDRWIFPVSRLTDKVLSGLVGKNVVALARKPASAVNACTAVPAN